MVSERVVISLVFGTMLLCGMEGWLYTKMELSKNTKLPRLDVSAQLQGIILLVLIVVVKSFDRPKIAHHIGVYCSWAYSIFAFLGLYGVLFLVILLLNYLDDRREETWVGITAWVIFLVHGLSSGAFFLWVFYESVTNVIYFREIRENDRRLQTARQYVAAIRDGAFEISGLQAMLMLLQDYNCLDWSSGYWEVVLGPYLRKFSHKLCPDDMLHNARRVCWVCVEHVRLNELFFEESTVQYVRYYHVSCIIKSQQWEFLNALGLENKLRSMLTELESDRRDSRETLDESQPTNV